MNFKTGLKPPVTCGDVEEQARINQESKNFLMRQLFKVGNNFRKLILVVLVAMALIAVVMIWAEDDFNPFNPFDWLRVLYFSVVAGSTTGFGDISPKSGPGMLMTMVFLVTMFILNTLFQANVTSRFVAQKDKYSHREQEDAELDNKHARAMVQLDLEMKFGRFPQDATWEQVQARIEAIIQENIDKNNAILDEMERQGAQLANQQS
ncbi:MAG TPA: potassium channel family protein [Candidatus Saccharimonadales bacterium]|nr:potassium channel family protein [Candidatus Saccharimonadales bacterium]